MTIQIEFESPEEISKDVIEPDFLHLHVSRDDIFLDKEQFTRVSLDMEAVIPIVPQYSEEELGEIKEFDKQVASTVAAFSFTQLVLNFAMSRSLKLLWGMLNVLMFILFMQKW